MEMTATDRPGLMSEISAVLAELGCHVSGAVAWTHNNRAACIVYLEDDLKHGPIMDPYRVAQIQAQLENVVEAHHYEGERRSVRLSAPAASQTHTERRLHQLMAADRDYEKCCSCGYDSSEDDVAHRQKKGCNSTEVKIENCKEKGYSIVTVRSIDRPKLLFDTICTLTDLQYVVFHASISSFESIAFQVICYFCPLIKLLPQSHSGSGPDSTKKHNLCFQHSTYAWKITGILCETQEWMDFAFRK